jgi:hypothetical protein
MKNKRTPFIVFTLFLLIVLGAIACRSTPPIVGYWQDVEQKNQYLEFSKDRRVIFDDGKNIITGTYELIGDNYIKVKFEGLEELSFLYLVLILGNIRYLETP